MDKPKRVTTHGFQSCLKYTLLAKLAPAWNRIAEYLVQGREFICSNDKLNAVGFDLSVNDTEMYLVLKAHIMRIPSLEVGDLGVARGVVTDFLSSYPDGHIAEHSIPNKWCHILPSMKKGQVVGVSHTIPCDSPFKVYKDIKKYWKNSYGYRLPESDDGMLYYQVYFKPIGHTLFTYPQCCVRRQDPVFLARPDSQPILDTFLADLHSRVGSVCNIRLQFATKPHYINNHLEEVTEVEKSKDDKRPNLSDERTAYIPPVRNRPMFTPLCNNMPTQFTTKAYTTKSTSISVSDLTVDSGYSSQNITPISGPKMIQPVFKPKLQPRSHSFQTDTNVQVPTALSVPMFKTLKPKHITTPNSDIPTPMVADIFPQISPTPSASGRVPSVLICDNQSVKSTPPVQTIETPAAQMGSKENVFSCKRLSIPKKTQFLDRSQHFRLASTTSKAMADIPNFGSTSNPYNNITKRSATPIAISTSSIVTCSTPKVIRKASPTVTTLPGSDILTAQNMRTTMGIKRVTPGGDCEEKSKKPRAKPKLQEDIDVESLARNNQLGKVNTVTLVSWLKERGVSCKSKDKKGDLIGKVHALLNFSVA